MAQHDIPLMYLSLWHWKTSFAACWPAHNNSLYADAGCCMFIVAVCTGKQQTFGNLGLSTCSRAEVDRQYKQFHAKSWAYIDVQWCDGALTPPAVVTDLS